MIAKSILFCEHPVILICDGKCDKAWGISNRPRVFHSASEPKAESEDDYFSLADGKLGIAPVFPGTWEGGGGKPRTKGERLNRWCARECERSILIPDGDTPGAINFDGSLPDWTRRRYNYSPRYRSETDEGATVLPSGFIEIVKEQEAEE